MTQLLTVDGRTLAPISEATYQLVRQHLPRVPAQPGVVWVAGTCWVASYWHADMLPTQFLGWECLNPREDALPGRRRLAQGYTEASA